MTEYTPTTEEVRSGYGKYWSELSAVSKEAVAEFDRWLAEHTRQVREELWDEIVPQYAHDWYWHDGGREQNPYRKEQS